MTGEILRHPERSFPHDATLALLRAQWQADSHKQETALKELQEALKVAGDWKIYPFAVHHLIARGRVKIDGRTVYVDGIKMPEYGHRLELCNK